MTGIKQQKLLLFRPKSLPFKCYTELSRVLNLTITSSSGR